MESMRQEQNTSTNEALEIRQIGSGIRDQVLLRCTAENRNEFKERT
jgi:microcompartment protein CcmK/EutM